MHAFARRPRKVRDEVLGQLNEAFGTPKSMGKAEFWHVKRPLGPDIHVCINCDGRAEVAHVMIFDPASAGRERVMEEFVKEAGEIRCVIHRIQRISQTAPALSRQLDASWASQSKTARG